MLSAGGPAQEERLLEVRIDAVCFVYTCRRLIDLSVIAGACDGDGGSLYLK